MLSNAFVVSKTVVRERSNSYADYHVVRYVYYDEAGGHICYEEEVVALYATDINGNRI